MRIIPEHELAPDDNPCEDCNRIRVTPITITDAKWRPDIWMNPFHCMDRHIKTKHDIYEAGATAMLKALLSLTGEGR